MKVLFANPPVYRSITCNQISSFHQGKHHRFLHQLPTSLRVRLYKLYASLNPTKQQRFGVRAGSRWPWVMVKPPGSPHYPFFMGYAAAVLQDDGYMVNIIDYVARQSFSYADFIADVLQQRSDVIVLEYTQPTSDIDQHLAQVIVSKSSARLILVGAGITTELAKQLQNHGLSFHACIQGEYALTLKKAIEGPKGEFYIGEGVMDLKNIPFPYRAFPEAALYFDPSMPTQKPQLQIYGSKGCPFRCTFCSWPQLMYNRKVVLRSAEEIKAEIIDAMKYHNYKSLFFDDDTFNLDTGRVSKISSMLAEFEMPWTWMGRLDCSPDWLYDQMISDGCVGMRFGVETFSMPALKAIKKGLERMDFEAALRRICAKYPKLMLHLTMMKNMPDQTQSDHDRDMEIMKELGFSNRSAIRSFQLSDCEPFPGTELYDQVNSGNAALTSLSSSYSNALK